MYRLTLVAALLGALSACGGSEPPSEPTAQEGREETRTIRNTEAVGYGGDAIADKLDATLDANDQRKEDMDQAIEAADE